MRKESYMGKIISIDEINRAVMEGKDDLVFELCKVFDHESYFDPIFDPPESFLQECEAYWNRRSPFCKTVERKIGNTWYTIETVCDGTEPLTAKVKRLIFSDREVTNYKKSRGNRKIFIWSKKGAENQALFRGLQKKLIMGQRTRSGL